MTVGASGTYAINGTELTLQPTDGRWIPQIVLGTTGDGHPMYSAIHEFAIHWVLINQTNLNQVQILRDAVNITGTVSIDLPAYRGADYVFQTYSGCTLYEPDRGQYFVEHTTEFTLIVGNIRV